MSSKPTLTIVLTTAWWAFAKVREAGEGTGLLFSRIINLQSAALPNLDRFAAEGTLLIRQIDSLQFSPPFQTDLSEARLAIQQGKPSI